MRSRIAFLLAVLFVLAALAGPAGARKTSSAPSVVGDWLGLFERGGVTLHVIIHVMAGPDGKLSATLDSPDQGNVKGLPLEEVSFKDQRLHFALPAAQFSFDGELSRDGFEVVGIWQQSGPVHVVFTRTDQTPPAVLPLERGSLKLAPCVGLPKLTREARCAKYEVFENRKTRTGRKIALNILLLPPTSGAGSNDPVFFISGGPGQSAVDLIKSGDFLPLLHRTRDLVFVDQRGTGESNPLNCPVTGDPNLLATVLAERYQPEALKQCRAELEKRADLTLYTTPIAMDDLDEVRDALGYNRINLFGGSYGTTAAMAYIRQHPDQVRTATLKGVAPVEAKLPIPFARGVEHALDQVITNCTADATCHGAFPDVRADLTALLKKFDAGPVTVKANNLITSKPEEFSLSREVLFENIRLLLYSPSTVRFLPWLIHQMSTGDFNPFASISFQVMSQLVRNLAQGMQMSVICAEDVPFATDALVASEMKNTMYGSGRVATMRAACADWPKAVTPAAFNLPVKADVPVLMISGEADPATPPWLAAEALKLLPNGRQLVIPNGTHLTQDDCIYRLIGQFIDEGSAKKLDPACLNSIKWMPFITGR
jgi:pimeloyl-ACP methyl ester carboxylesterase